MNVIVTKRWHWRGGILQPGQRLTMPDKHGQVLIDAGVAESADVRELESAMLEPPREAAVTKRPRGRPRKVRPA